MTLGFYKDGKFIGSLNASDWYATGNVAIKDEYIDLGHLVNAANEMASKLGGCIYDLDEGELHMKTAAGYDPVAEFKTFCTSYVIEDEDLDHLLHLADPQALLRALRIVKAIKYGYDADAYIEETLDAWKNEVSWISRADLLDYLTLYYKRYHSPLVGTLGIEAFREQMQGLSTQELREAYLPLDYLWNDEDIAAEMNRIVAKWNGA